MDFQDILPMVEHLQKNIVLTGYHMFSCGGFGSDEDYSIGLIKTDDQYECLRVFETNGVNYNLDTNDIIAFLQRWKTEVSFSIIDVSHDRVGIQLATLDFDLDTFAKEVLEFCPDFLAAVNNAN